jgi:hypothetical protein
MNLVAKFPGLRMVVRRRMLTIPSGAEEIVYSAAPPFNESVESSVKISLAAFNKTLVKFGITSGWGTS